MRRLLLFLGFLSLATSVSAMEREPLWSLFSPGEVRLTDELWLTMNHRVRLGIAATVNTVDLGARGERQSYLNGLLRSRGVLGWSDLASLAFRMDWGPPNGYAAPMVGAGTVTSGGVEFENYFSRNAPFRVTELALRGQMPRHWSRAFPLTVELGLLPFGVPGSYPLSRKYANLGASLSAEHGWGFWRLHWEKADTAHELFLGEYTGPEAVFANQTWGASFFAADFAFTWQPVQWRPYASVLLDDSPPERRRSAFPVAIRRDLLGTAGSVLTITTAPVSILIEGAANFGDAETLDGTTIPHEGWLGRMEFAVDTGILVPKLLGAVASGNSVSRESVDAAGGYVPTVNRAFSVHSPFNLHLFDSRFPRSFGPMVAMGTGYALHTGIPRPGSFGSPSLLENVILVGLGTDIRWGPSFSAEIRWWYLQALEDAWGQRLDGVQNGVPVYRTVALDADLGHEIDVSARLGLGDHLAVSAMAGVFFPGGYYEAIREDLNPTGQFPIVRFDGDPEPAFQFDIGVELFL